MDYIRISVRKIVAILSLVGLFFLGSCSDNNDELITQSRDMSLLLGNWCTVNDFGQATVLELYSSHRISGVSYYSGDEGNKEEAFSGVWVYYSNNDVLSMQLVYSSSLQANSTSFKLVTLTENELSIANQDLNESSVSYYHLKGTKSASIGETIQLDGNGISSVVSSNPSSVVAKSDGTVKAVAPGKSFVLVVDENGSHYVIVDVESIEDMFMSEVIGNIDDVLATHGTPDVEGTIGMNSAVLYRTNLPDGYKALQYQFDATTREVTRILVQYGEKSAWDSSVSQLKNNLKQDGGDFYPGTTLLDSKYYASTWEENGIYYISYNNLIYFLQQGYF